MSHIPAETLQELCQLRDRVQYLEAELALYRDENNADTERVMKAFGVTFQQARTLIALARGGILTRDMAVALNLNRVRDADPRSLDSCIKRLRIALPQIEIKSHYGLGYELSPAFTKRVRQVLRGR